MKYLKVKAMDTRLRWYDKEWLISFTENNLELERDTWIWVIVQDPGGDEMFLGQYDEKKELSFIPAFLEKNDAKASLDLINKDDALEYEAQAIKYGLLVQYCKENNFVVYICNASGEVLFKPM